MLGGSCSRFRRLSRVASSFPLFRVCSSSRLFRACKDCHPRAEASKHTQVDELDLQMEPSSV